MESNKTKQINKHNKTETDTVAENKLVVTRVEGAWVMSEIGKGD